MSEPEKHWQYFEISGTIARFDGHDVSEATQRLIETQFREWLSVHGYAFQGQIVLVPPPEPGATMLAMPATESTGDSAMLDR